MQLQLKDVIHLYLGCECQYEDKQDGIVKGRFAGIDVVEGDYSIVMITVRTGDNPIDDDYTILNDNEDLDRIKLILRRPSDIQYKEAEQLCAMQIVGMRDEDRVKIFYADEHIVFKIYTDGEDDLEIARRVTRYVHYNNLNAKQFAYLLSKGFDLFGLIESGQAINKATIKTGQTETKTGTLQA